MTINPTKKDHPTACLAAEVGRSANIDSQEETRMPTTILAQDPSPLQDVKPEPLPTCTPWCEWGDNTARPEVGHNCCADGGPYLPALHSISVDGLSSTAPPLVSANAWKCEETGLLSVSVHATCEERRYSDPDSGYDIDLNFDPRNARLLAAQLLAAADLVDGTVR
jgi:hypothetical protein